MASSAPSLQHYRPAVGKPLLFFTAGAVWLAMGIMLIIFASSWLKLAASPLAYLINGIALASAVYYLGFSRLAKKNVRRIHSIALRRICVFAFQEWRSYPLVLLMIFLGVYLRLFSPIPKPMLAIVYLGIGGALMLSSLHYFLQFLELQAVKLAGDPR